MSSGIVLWVRCNENYVMSPTTFSHRSLGSMSPPLWCSKPGLKEWLNIFQQNCSLPHGCLRNFYNPVIPIMWFPHSELSGLLHLQRQWKGVQPAVPQWEGFVYGWHREWDGQHEPPDPGRQLLWKLSPRQNLVGWSQFYRITLPCLQIKKKYFWLDYYQVHGPEGRQQLY